MTEKLVFDLDKHQIGNFILGQPMGSEGASVTIQKNTKEGWYITSSKGIVVTIFLCIKEGYEGYSRFKGVIEKGGRKIDIDENSTPQEIDGLFGVPEEFFEDDVSISRRYRINHELVEFDWGAEGDTPKLRYCALEVLNN